MLKFSMALVATFSLFAAGCTHKAAAQRGEVEVKASVLVASDGAGGYTFKYDAPFADEKGNFDFSQKGALYNKVSLSFTIAEGSVGGLKFKPTAADAIWLVEKKDVDPATGSPRGPYQGRQFHSFAVSDDGLTLTLVDENNDGLLYRYGLRFDLGAETVIDDPDTQNGGVGGHG